MIAQMIFQLFNLSLHTQHLVSIFVCIINGTLKALNLKILNDFLNSSLFIFTYIKECESLHLKILQTIFVAPFMLWLRDNIFGLTIDKYEIAGDLMFSRVNWLF